jgi:fatty-acyl-CoA synthase
MLSTMQDFPLTIGMIFRHGRTVFGDSEVVTFEGESSRRASFAQVANRVDQLSAALRRLGVESGDRVATFSWNIQEHLEAYFAIPCMGGVLHTLNIRLYPDQLVYIVNHAEDKIVIVDGTLVPVLAKLAPELSSVESYVVVGDADTASLEGNRAQVFRYDELLAAEQPGITYPEIDERAAAAMCYTSGTTGNPKGVVYSHRSTFLHSLGVLQPSAVGFSDRDRVLPVVPMFHANAWGMPYAAWMAGADLIMPNRFLQPEPLARLIEQERPTCAGAVPTIWTELLHYSEQNAVDFSSMQRVLCGGSAVPRSLIERFQDQFDVRIVQGWGMTETSPLAAVSLPPKGVELGTTEEIDWRAKSGRVIAGIEVRLVDDDGVVQPWDGEAVGEVQIRGPWVTGSYYRDADPQKFEDGWLRTGDIASITSNGYIQITDRAKDVIKSGGEWISSVELEVRLMAHPGVAEAAVIAVPDPRWEERPLACVVCKSDTEISAHELREFLGESIARWQLPERWAFIAEVPKTSVGKFDKKVLRARYADGVLVVEELA